MATYRDGSITRVLAVLAAAILTMAWLSPRAQDVDIIVFTREVSMSPKKTVTGFTAEERAAMKEHIQELKGGKGEGEAAVLAKIAAMSESDRVMARRVHAIVMASAPALTPKLWYGMPAYAKDGKVVCFFQGAQKFKTRYATFGFSDKANLDEGNVWPTTFALQKLTPADEARIGALVKKAVT